ncbi:ATP-binding protein [Methylotenera sp. G11]|uniref:ATP-binding protein n=1 Tax=Methylotenera sp. G11 TaxID=1506585 RepID=UPI00068A50C3|nr:ATP-binding protein [Methylotenera sp. G11]
MQFKDRIFIMAGLSLVACMLALSAEFNTHALSAIMDDHSVGHASLGLTCFLTVVFAVLPFLWFSKLSPVYALLSICAYILAIVTLVFAAAYLFKIWVPPTGCILAILLAYPIWSCARLNSAQAALDHALQNLQDELARLGMEQESGQPHSGEDPQQARIRKLALTARHLRDMHKARSDTLVFISHDIRTPLGAAMLLLEKFEQNKYRGRIEHLLTRAHTMAEGFLQASRAEMSDVNKFNVLDMVSLTQQVVDDVYELLTTKNISLEMHHPDENVWVRGDFGLLFRAVSNILQNAVNYSPERSVIRVVIDKDDVMLRLKVTDQGPGIPEDKIQKLFRRFTRADGEHQDQGGSGLGLYFVDVTVRKHRGTVSAANIPMRGAEFVITLPLERRRKNLPVAYDRRAKPQSTFEDII